MSLLVARSTRFTEHDPGPGHPERPERNAAALRGLEGAGVPLEDVPLRPVTEAELLRVHAPSFVEQLEAMRGRAGQLDPDTHTSPASVEVAALGAGATIDLFTRVAEGQGRAGFSLVRPPGHHSTPTQAMGFCLYGNLAVAAKHLLETQVVERIVIYDWDVHHGNGTQDMFWEDPRVLFMSTHQAPFYPGTGSMKETGAGAGEGTTVNLPCPAGTTEAQILGLNEDVLIPRARDFAPDIILISAGFDAHLDDPLGSLGMSTAGFGELASRWRDLAEEVCGGRIAALLEGGYDLNALESSVAATAKAWG